MLMKSGFVILYLSLRHEYIEFLKFLDIFLRACWGVEIINVTIFHISVHFQTCEWVVGVWRSVDAWRVTLSGGMARKHPAACSWLLPSNSLYHVHFTGYIINQLQCRYFATKIGKSAKLIQRICVCFYALPDLVTYYITSEKKSVICQQWHYQVATISIFSSTSLKLQNKTAS